jgi:hypothetical protein
MRAIEKKADVAATLRTWRHAFEDGSEVIGSMGSQPVRWHERLGIWGLFGQTHGKEPAGRSWNAFGQRPQGSCQFNADASRQVGAGLLRASLS